MVETEEKALAYLLEGRRLGGPQQGKCTAEYGVRSWHRHYQAPTVPNRAQTCLAVPSLLLSSVQLDKVTAVADLPHMIRYRDAGEALRRQQGKPRHWHALGARDWPLDGQWTRHVAAAFVSPRFEGLLAFGSEISGALATLHRRE
ncbi:hypothetical protein FDECE_8209 [Fusarium decemcellulare]|nr:hypothetical protein FDECE_8209 [Fusarium decemcellulare]